MEINNELRDKAFDCAKRHGFHDEEHSDEYLLMLIITEMGEAIDADRKNKHANVDFFNRSYNGSDSKFGYEKLIKGTVEDELADVVIRCLDFAGLKNIDIYGFDKIVDYKDLVKEGYENISIIEFLFSVTSFIFKSLVLYGKYPICLASLALCLSSLDIFPLPSKQYLVISGVFLLRTFFTVAIVPTSPFFF